MNDNIDSYEILNDTEEMYKNIISNIMDIIIVLDLKGNFLYVSPQIYDISGFKPEELIGKSSFKFMHLDDIKKAADVLKEAITQKNKMHLEYRTIHKEGYYIDVSASGRIVNMEGEDRIFAIVRDISEKKSSEQKLRESEKVHKTLSKELEEIFDRIPASIFRKNREGEYTQVNQAIADAFNLSKEAIIGKTSFDFFPSGQAEIFHENDLKVMKSGEPQLNNMTVDIEGKKRQLIMNKIPQFNIEGDVIGLIGITTDISQSIAYEQEIIESEKKYRQLIEDSLEGVWIIDADANTTLVNPSMSRILGYEVAEMLGRNLFDFTAQEDIKTTKNTLERRKKGVKEEIERRFIRKDGKEVITRLLASPIFNQNEEYKGAIAFVSDITERKRTEILLKESEEKYSHLFKEAPYSIIIGDMNGTIIDCNFEEDRISGYTREEIIGKTMLDIPMFPHEYFPKAIKDFETLLKGEMPKPSELQIIRKDGSFVWVQPSASIFKLKDEIYLQIIMQDVNERKISEEKLKESEEKFRNIAEQSFMGIMVIQDGLFKYFNEKASEVNGYSMDEIRNWKSNEFAKILHPNDKEFVMEQAAKKQAGDPDVINNYQTRIIRKDGEIRWLDIFSKTINYEGSTADLVMNIDITDKIKAEQKLKESEERFRTLFEIAPASITVLDLNGNIILSNQKFCELHGVKEPQLLEGRNIRDFFIKSDLPKLRELMKLSLDGKSRDLNHYTMLREDGTQFLAEAISSGIKDKNGEVIGLIGVAQDITERRNAEQELRESEEKFRTLFETVPASIVVSDINGNIILSNQKFCELHGVKDSEHLKGRNVGEFFIESDLPELMESIKLSLEGKLLDLKQYTMLREDGTKFPAEAISIGIKDKNGEIKELIGVAQDITDRENAAQELRESEEKFRTIAEQSFMGVLIIQDDNVEYVNKALLDIFNFSEKDIDNWSKEDLINLINPQDLQYLRDYRNKLRQGELEVKPYYSYQVFTKSGKPKWIDQFSKEIKYKGKPAELVTIMDITEKKEAEQELVKLNSLKSELMRRTSHELKTPLVSIKGYSDLLLNVHRENLDDYVIASIVEIKQGCERLESLIQDILNTAELESGTVQLKKVEDDLAFFIKLSIRELRGLARLRNQTVSSNINNKLITSFEPEQIHQVISNLINNAIKYTPPDGTIEIESDVKDGYITVSVKDSGIGITKEEEERLFTQFGKIERYGQGLDIISEGSGLGLYISKKVIELHGGKIWVESQGRNKGSTFSFSLPIIHSPSE